MYHGHVTRVSLIIKYIINNIEGHNFITAKKLIKLK